MSRADLPVVRAADSERDQRRAAAALRAAGLSAGDRVLISAAASPALLAVVLGALRTGVVPVVLDPALPTAERAALAADADADLDVGAEPERLLTGTRPEPTFLITKPFQRSTVKAAIAQALFFDAATVPAA